MERYANKKMFPKQKGLCEVEIFALFYSFYGQSNVKKISLIVVCIKRFSTYIFN